MTIRWLMFGLASLMLGGSLQADDSTPDHLNPPTGRIEMVLDSDMFNEVDDQFALAFTVRRAVCHDILEFFARVLDIRTPPVALTSFEGRRGTRKSVTCPQ